MELEDTFKNNLNTVKEIILDEEKLVTYISLSKDLCIHVNTSKLLLHHLIDKIHLENPNILINVTYIISGTIGDNKVWTTVSNADNLAKLKLKFTNIFYEHVYSINKGNSTVDPNAYLLLNTFNDFNLCTGLIKSKECDKRTSNEIVNLKTNSQEFVPVSDDKKSIDPLKKIKQESKQTLNLQTKIKDIENKPFTHEDKKNEVNLKSEVPSPQKKSNNKPNNITNCHKTQKGITGFFNKSNGDIKKLPIEIKKEPKVKPEENVNVEDQTMDIDEEESSKSTLKVLMKEESESESNLSINGKSSKKNKNLQQTKKTYKVDKKRKRVLHVSDSDSDTENDPFVNNQEINNESDDEIPPTPSNNTIKITSGIVNPKKRRKVVDKTYTDEDGYVLTKKEEVYESCSENEQDVKVVVDTKPLKQDTKEISPTEKKSGPKTSKKKISPPQKGKQSTLTSFFKKKVGVVI